MHLRPLKCYWLCMKILFDTSRRIIPVTSRNNSLEKTNRLMALQMLPVIIKMTRQYTRKKLAITIATTRMRMHVARERVEQSIAIIIFHLQKQFLIFGNYHFDLPPRLNPQWSISNFLIHIKNVSKISQNSFNSPFHISTRLTIYNKKRTRSIELPDPQCQKVN